MKPTDFDRLAFCELPDTQPIMHQNWGKLLFMHWRIEEDLLRPFLPEKLEVDKFDGSAWIAIAAFTMWNVQALPRYLPPLPRFSSMHELNVRTYVHFGREPGVWFFSLDCNSSAAVLAARRFFFLPYYKAEIDLQQQEERISYSLTRIDDPPSDFNASWKIGAPLPYSHPGSLEFFLTERYCLFSKHNHKLYRARIHHQPWPLQEATLCRYRSTMIESQGLPAPRGEPLLLYAPELSVDIWPLERALGQT